MNPSPDRDDEARRLAVERIAALIGEARDHGIGTLLGQGAANPAIAKALAELRALDPALQRRVARAMVRSKGDPEALRAALEAGPADGAPGHAPTRKGPVSARYGRRPPTVVDARGPASRLAIPVALLCAAIAAFVLAQ